MFFSGVIFSKEVPFVIQYFPTQVWLTVTSTISVHIRLLPLIPVDVLIPVAVERIVTALHVSKGHAFHSILRQTLHVVVS